MASGRREYELMFMLKAAVDSGFASSFKGAANMTHSLQSEIEKVNSVRSNISSYQKQQDALTRNEAKLQQQKAEYEKLAAEMKATKTPSEELTRKFEKKEAQVAKTTATVERNKNNLNQLESELREAGVDTNNLTAENEQLSRSYEELRTAQQNLGRLNNEIAANKAAIAQTKSELMTTINVIEMAGTAAYNGIIKPTMALEAEMSKVEAISGATAADMIQLQQKAKDLGVSTKFTATEAAEGFEYMAMAGWKTADMLSGIDGILNLAAASGEDLGTTSDIVTDALTAFGLKASDSAHFADILAAASSNANTNVSMMGESFKYAAPLAGALGFSAEDTALAIGLMANSGIKASQAGTSLRKIFANLSSDLGIMQANESIVTVETTNMDGSMRSLKDIVDDLRVAFNGMSDAQKEAIGNDLTDQANALGVELKDENGKLKTQAELYEDVALALDGLTESGQVAEAESIAGKTAMAGLLTLVNASEEDYNKLANAIYNCDGATKQMADTMIDNLQGDFTLAQSALEGLAIATGSALTPTIREATQAITEKIQALAKWVEANPKTVQTIAKLVTTLAALKLGTLGVKLGFQEVKGGVLTAKKVFTELQVASKYLNGSLQTASTTTKALAGAMGFIASPAGIAVAAIGAAAAAGYMIYKQYQKSREEMLNFADGLNKAAEGYKQVADKADATQALISEYRQLEAKTKDVATSAEEAASAKQRMKEIEDQLIEQNPNVLSKYDQENGKISEQIGKLSELTEQERELARIKYEQEATEASKTLPNTEAEIVNLRQKIDGLKEQYHAEHDVELGLTSIMNEWNAFYARDHSEAEKAEKLRELEQAASDLMKTLGKDYDFSGSGMSGIASTLDTISNSTDKTVEKLEKYSGELSTAEQSQRDYYNNCQALIQMDLGGTYQDIADKLSSLKSAQQELNDTGIISDETMSKVQAIAPELQNASDKNAVLQASIGEIEGKLATAETQAIQFGTTLDGTCRASEEELATMQSNFILVSAALNKVQNGVELTSEEIKALEGVIPGIAQAADKPAALKQAFDNLKSSLEYNCTKVSDLQREINSLQDKDIKISVTKVTKEVTEKAGILNKIGGFFAKGTERTPDTFVAGENGAELITGQEGKKVFTAFQTRRIFSNMREIQNQARSVVAASAMLEGRSLRGYATGTARTTEDFIAGENGAELITNTATALRAMDLLSYTFAPRLPSVNAPTVKDTPPSVGSSITFAPGAIQYSPVIQGDDTRDIGKILEKHADVLIDLIMNRLQDMADDERRRQFV